MSAEKALVNVNGIEYRWPKKPVAVNAALAKWLAAKLPDYWKA